MVGSANVDLVARAPSIPRPGETLLGSEFFQAAGGKGANQAVAAARLGAEVAFVARVGDDRFGADAIEGYRAEGIDTNHVIVDPERPTGVALIVVSDDGENAITVAPGANGRLSAGDVERAAAVLRRADVLLVQLEVPLDAVARALEIANDAGVATVLDPAPARHLDPALLARVDVLTPNLAEARTLAGLEARGLADAEHLAVPDADAERLAGRLRERGVGACAVTLGPDGVVLADALGTRRFAAQRVAAVDTTGAGDAFNGALAVGLAEGMDLDGAVAFALRAAAVSVTRAGAQPSLPRRGELGGQDSADSGRNV